MEAKDTVMTKEQMVIIWLSYEQSCGFLKNCDVEEALIDPALFNEDEYNHSKLVALKQAEISFAAGLAEAEKKVAEAVVEERKKLINQIEGMSNPTNTNMFGISLSKSQWEALKSGKKVG